MSDSPLQSAAGSGIAQAFGQGAIATVQIGFTSEEVATLLQAAGSAHQAKIDDLAAQLNANREAVQGFLRILKEDEVPVEQLAMKLMLIAQRYVAMLARLEVLDPADNEVRSYVERAEKILRAASSTKDYESADDLLTRAEEIQDRNLRNAELFEREAREATGRLRRSSGTIRAVRGYISFIRLDYIQAAQHFRAAAALFSEVDPSIELEILALSGNALGSYGSDKGDRQKLLQAIDVYREVLKRYTREGNPLNWAKTQRRLGETLSLLGWRESGTEHLEEAIEAYKAVLTVQTREQMPLEWAGIQCRLGNTLTILGRRESGTARLTEAVKAFQAALTVQRREQVPIDWALTQNELGILLFTLGERDIESSHLEDAVTAFRQALKEITRERWPMNWASIQNNLGLALHRLGALEAPPTEIIKSSPRMRGLAFWLKLKYKLATPHNPNGITYLEEAQEALNEALKEYTRERVPLDWALTQNNLGAVLQSLGERETGTAYFEKALEAYRESLKERTPERVPVDWATTENNLGVALYSLYRRQNKAVYLEEAVSAYCEALKAQTRAHVPLAWARTQYNLGNALLALGKREASRAYLKRAIAAYRMALKEYTFKRMLPYWIAARMGLGITLWESGRVFLSLGRGNKSSPMI